MRYLWLMAMLCVTGSALSLGLRSIKADEPAQQTGDATAQQAGDEPAANDSVSEDEAAVRETVAAYVAAFNKGDAKTLASFWSDGGELITADGETLRGHEQLEERFSAYFSQAKDAKLELVDTAVRFLSPRVAVESGMARVIVPDTEPTETQYEVLHVKTAEGWRMDRVTEQQLPAPAPSHYEQLKELEWMIGTWVDAGEDATVTTTCRWTTNQNFLVRSFKVLVDDQVDFEGTQIIGWDPLHETIRSWLFDSDGGFGAGRWSREDSRWVVKSLQVLADGRRASATSILELMDDNTVSFQVIGRQVGGEMLPNIGPVQLRRTDQ